MALQARVVAPEFGLLATPYQRVALSEFDRPVVLIFYPADWSPECNDELTVFNAASGFFRARGAQILGISVDGPWCHEAFKEQRKVAFPLLTDCNSKGKVAWSEVSPVGVNPGADGTLRAVEVLT